MKKRTLKRKVVNFIGIAVIICGIGMFLYPDVKTFCMEQQTNDRIAEFQKYAPLDGSDPVGQEKMDNSSDGNTRVTEDLWDHIKDYNEQIFADGQTGFKDAWSAAQIPVAVDGLVTGMFGYIEIPAMDVTLPLYVGATMEHMSEGAAVLGGTSIPIGGINTNSVIAGHRGYRGAPYFRDIEELTVGDDIYITNPWETLVYRVESIDIIAPDGSDAVKIQEGKDMVTLLTCHPYRSGGKYRYVVYCIRDGSMDFEEQDETGLYITASDGNRYDTSRNDIQLENMIRKCGALAVIVAICITFLTNRINKNRERRQE